MLRLWALAALAAAPAAALEVSVAASAAWPAAPLAAELLEGLAEVGLAAPYLRALAAEGGDAGAWRRASARAAEAQLAGGAGSTAGRFLSLRARHAAASASVEASVGLERADRAALAAALTRRGCPERGPWVALRSPKGAVDVACTAEAFEALAAALHQEPSGGDRSWAPEKTTLDHALYDLDGQSGEAAQVVGYAPLDGGPALGALLRCLVASADALAASHRPGRVVFRHGAGESAEGAPVAGFGMELQARSADEVAKSSDSGSAAGGADAACVDAELNATATDPVYGFHGIDLGVLAARHPGASGALCRLQGDLRRSVESPPPPWELKRLGAHAALRVLKAANGPGGPSAGLAALEEAASDYPAGWAQALAAAGVAEEGAARVLLEKAARLPESGALEVNGWTVPLPRKGPLQLLQAHAPLFRAAESLASMGFDEAVVAAVLRDTRPPPPAPSKMDLGDARLHEGGGGLPLLYDARSDPTTEDLRKREAGERYPPLARLASFYGRQFGYPPPIPRAFVGVSLVLDPCEPTHIQAAEALVAKAPPLTVGVHLTSPKRPKVAALLQAALDGERPWAPMRLLSDFLAAGRKVQGGICGKGVKKRIEQVWETLWQAERKPVPTLEAKEGGATGGGLSAPTAVVNGRLVQGDEILEKGALSRLCQTAIETLIAALQWGQGPPVQGTDAEIAEWQYFGGSRKPLLRNWHPALVGDAAVGSRILPLAPTAILPLPGGRAPGADGGPPIAHVLLLGDPQADGAISDAPAAFLAAYAQHLAAAGPSDWEEPGQPSARWLHVAVAGPCSADSGPPPPAVALRRCLAAVAASGDLQPSAAASLAGALARAANVSDASRPSLLDACRGAAREDGWPTPEALDDDGLDAAYCATQLDVARALGPVQGGAAALWVNGRRYGPMRPVEQGMPFAASHVALLEELAMMYGPRHRGTSSTSARWPVSAAAEALGRASTAGADPLRLVYALAVRARAVEEVAASRRSSEAVQEEEGAKPARDEDEEEVPPAQQAFWTAPAFLRLHLRPDPAQASLLRAFAVIDPLSQAAQRLPPLLRLLHEELNAEVGIVLKPTPLVAPPLQSYYRAVRVAPAPAGAGLAALGDWDGRVPEVRLEVPPRRGQLLSLQLLTPASWLCAAVDSTGADLDNLAAEAPDIVKAHYRLESLFIEGWAGTSRRSPAAGRQLGLTPMGGGAAGPPDAGADSVVVKSGYFQLRASPGLYSVGLLGGEEGERVLRPTGGIELVELGGGGAQLEVSVGQAAADASPQAGAAAARAPLERGRFEGAGGDRAKCSKTVHVFSVASGHRYERLLRIMMLSVRSKTDCPLRFWLVENFLSPNFRKLLPRLADKVGFAVSTVTYKWPAWLRAQTEKQRVIWAYKILFLDVFFPSEVERVLFIDADQIVRADVKELWDIDLKGAVYGFVPFCGGGAKSSSWFGGSEDIRNQETLGFRFWEQGFWARHLNDRPYHISALFVVDLKRFREKAAGDILREVYQQLTADPHSLANLDQDLPNYVQRDLPIFSLPQEWLWCESWCSDASKARAKTIDMCQNPVKKEGKLQQARRIAPEWVEYDDRLEAWVREIEGATP